MSTAERHGDRIRRPGDVIRIVIGGVGLLVTSWLAHRASPSVVELNLFTLINQLPAAFGPPLLGGMQFGALAAVLVFALGAFLGRRPYLARLLLVGCGLAWLAAKLLQHVIDEEPPSVVVGKVALHGAVVPGLAFPSTHVAVVAAAATIAGPYLTRASHRAAWLLVTVVAIARVYVGAHFPIDVIGGVAVGVVVGSGLHLLLGAPNRSIGPTSVIAVLRRVGIEPQGVIEVDAGGKETALFRVRATDQELAVKVVRRDQPDADWLYRSWRLLAFREFEDETAIASPVHRVERQANVLLTAQRAGLAVAPLICTVTAASGDAVLIRRWIDGLPLSSIGLLREDTLDHVWLQLRRFHELGAVHGSPRSDRWVVDADGKSWLVEVGAAKLGASPDEQLADIAELLASLSLQAPPDQVVSSAVTALGIQRVADALPLLQPLSLTPPTRAAVTGRDRLLEQLRAEVGVLTGTDVAPVAAPVRVALRNVLPLIAALFAVNLLLPQLAHAGPTFKALRSARTPWLALALLAASMSYLMAAVALLGAAARRLALGRTWAVQIAAAFTNRLAPAGLGGMATNTRYLESSGARRTEAIAAVGLNSAAGVVVHVVGLVAVFALVRTTGTHFKVPDPPDSGAWMVLIVITAVLVLGGLVRWRKYLHRRLGPPIRSAWTALSAVARKPAAVVALIVGSAGVTAAYGMALVACSRAVGVTTHPLTILAVYLAGSALASTSPTPGGLGAVEAALVAGLTATGIPIGTAVAAVLCFRLITYWLPVLPGAVAFRILHSSGTI